MVIKYKFSYSGLSVIGSSGGGLGSGGSGLFSMLSLSLGSLSSGNSGLGFLLGLDFLLLGNSDSSLCDLDLFLGFFDCCGVNMGLLLLLSLCLGVLFVNLSLGSFVCLLEFSHLLNFCFLGLGMLLGKSSFSGSDFPLGCFSSGSNLGLVVSLDSGISFDLKSISLSLKRLVSNFLLGSVVLLSFGSNLSLLNFLLADLGSSSNGLGSLSKFLTCFVGSGISLLGCLLGLLLGTLIVT